ncbi:nucleolar protein 6 [Venturia canescens]|uniref:nucleolar protein 6 n=1 Tax=Venturia canescens TaxID=32260 RepID=UPI001C9CC859|nr:nucleolar protein 6 [Venturia canescens]
MVKENPFTSEVDGDIQKTSNDFSFENFVDDDDDIDQSEAESEASEESPAKGNKRVADRDSTEENQKKKRRKDLFKQPTTDELNQLRETETLFHSNLFRLQIEEVLSATRVKDKYRKLFDAWFLKFKKNIFSIKESEETPLTTAGKIIQEVKVPESITQSDQKGVFKFLKPLNIQVIGSYFLGCVTGPDIVIDVMIEMPSKFFQKLDYQNYRYMKKRALYLAWLTANMDQELVDSKNFVGDVWTPILQLIPKGKLSKRITIHVHLGAEESSFKLNRFLPEKNSVRPEWYFNDDKITEDQSLLPTPHYNSIVLRDLTMSRVNNAGAKIVREYPNVRDGIILLKIWLRQRELNESHDSFNNHIMTMYVLHLLFEKKLNTFMSSYQIVRNVWINLGLSDWNGKGAAMCSENEVETRLSEYQKYYDCVFLDITGYHNLAAHLSVDTYNWVRSEAQRAVKCLDNPNLDSFQTLFMRPVPFCRTFDNIICFNDMAVIEKIIENYASLNEKLDYGPDKRTQAVKLITGVLKKGLGNRISNLYVKAGTPKSWAITADPLKSPDKIMIGFSLDPDNCFNIIDKGPHANLEEAAIFRNFWGNKSELRRFQDGSICEALVWAKSKKTLSIKRIICKKIVTFLLKEKFDLSKNQYEYVADEIEEFLQLKKIKGLKFANGTGEEATLQVLRVFGVLEKELTSLTDLPLSISGVEGCSPVFRYTEVFPPLSAVTDSTNDSLVTRAESHYSMINEKSSKRVPKYVPQIDANVQLCMSGKWPNELEAIRKTKAAFHIQIAECLRTQCQLTAQANSHWVDVLKEGFVFRLEVAHQKEVALLKREISEDHVQKYRDNDESIELEKRLFHLPKLSSALHGLHSQQPSFGPTCCLAKRWLSAHLLDESHIPGIVVELLVASIYLTPDPYKPAQTPQVAFLRFLEFFTRRQWSTEPIFVNFNNGMTREEIVTVENAFRSGGESYPPIFISTPYDHDGSIWSKKAPSKLVLNRIGSLAEQALKLVDQQLDTVSRLSFRAIFKASISEYDFLIRVHSSLNPRRYQFHDLSDKYPITDLQRLEDEPMKKIPVIAFDPVQCYLRELRRGYDEVALFFHDTYGGSVIGVLLKPSILEKKEFKISNLSCRKLNEEGKLVLDVSAMIEDFSILGKGLVKSVDVQSKRVELD